ncbi:ABC transporter permease subunit [Paenibacillus sp. LHD-38]|uniref:ABC transporter permease n=1 Tax=Paenibacillus sp. LHD-38 TaxID=3072143 RepID=UPI00280C984A|nr:ABC transporter permease subunit [Paenibacillus sp. LHD-38]MDQ8739024.1 ABC transporter permease subunit [Paenibacillus sp. LHD-38]
MQNVQSTEKKYVRWENVKKPLRSESPKKPLRWDKLKAQLEIQSMVWPGLLFLLLFAYVPMYGLLIAFKEYDIFLGIYESPWVGLEHFKEFFIDTNFFKVLRNTIAINLLGLIIGFPIPILFALMLNEITNMWFKKWVQTISYLPHFISVVVFGALIMNVLSPTNGIVNEVLVSVGILDEPLNFMGEPNYFWGIYIVGEILKGMGWGAILYFSAIAGVDQDMYEAATIDGATRFQKMRHITVPSIMGTIVIMFIFAVAALLNTGAEQVLVLQNALNLETSETIDTYVYKLGLRNMRYSYSTAVGLAKSIVAVLLLLGANYLSKKVTNKGLF